jgi:23S rRNA pseudouridine955/2504/2580 synthase
MFSDESQLELSLCIFSRHDQLRNIKGHHRVTDHSRVQFVEVGADSAGQRLDNFLLKTLKGAPKSLIYRIIRKGEVRVNKGRTKPDYKLKLEDIVRVPPVRLADRGETIPVSEELKRILLDSILFEDDELLVINKPAGLAVHGGSGVNVGMIEALRNCYPGQFLELVHRLDRATSGCIMVAKTRKNLTYLQDLLRDAHQIEKVYTLIVYGVWPETENAVELPLARDIEEGGERLVRVSTDGKFARTEFKRLRKMKSASVLEASPITGRTHQIRVHAASQGHALVGDHKYADKSDLDQSREQGLKRLYLHASRLRIPREEGADLIVEAELPEEFNNAINRLS